MPIIIAGYLRKDIVIIFSLPVLTKCIGEKGKVNAINGLSLVVSDNNYKSMSPQMKNSVFFSKWVFTNRMSLYVHFLLQSLALVHRLHSFVGVMN